MGYANCLRLLAANGSPIKVRRLADSWHWSVVSRRLITKRSRPKFNIDHRILCPKLSVKRRKFGLAERKIIEAGRRRPEDHPFLAIIKICAPIGKRHFPVIQSLSPNQPMTRPGGPPNWRDSQTVQVACFFLLHPQSSYLEVALYVTGGRCPPWSMLVANPGRRWQYMQTTPLERIPPRQYEQPNTENQDCQ